MKSLAMNCWCPRKSISLYLIFGFLVTTKIPQELNLLRSERLFRLLCIPLDELGLFRDCAKTHSFLKRKKTILMMWRIYFVDDSVPQTPFQHCYGLAEKTVMLLNKFYPRPWRNNYRSLTAAELQLQPALSVFAENDNNQNYSGNNHHNKQAVVRA